MIKVDKDNVTINGTLDKICSEICSVISAVMKTLPKDADQDTKSYVSYMFRALIFRITRQAEEAGLDMNLTGQDREFFEEALAKSKKGEKK